MSKLGIYRAVLWSCLAVLALLFIAAISSHSDLSMPDDEVRFINAVSGYKTNFIEAKNELQQSSMRAERAKAISESLNHFSANDWIGTVSSLETNSDGKAILSISIAPNVQVKTYNNEFSDSGLGTLIEKNSTVYANLFNSTVGQQVKFSGNFFQSKDDYIKELSLTTNGSMKDPEFLFNFSSVEAVKQ